MIAALALVSRFRRAPAAPGRIEVCPPAIFRGPEPGLRRWLRRLAAPKSLQPAERLDPVSRVRAVRQEFADALGDIRTQHAEFLQGRVQRTYSLRDLWHLRAEIYSVISLHHSQEEAERRLARLNRHFPTRSPRSGFGDL